MPVTPNTPQYYAKDRKAWRKWLEKNHATEKYVWLVIYRKNASKKSVTYVEAVEEALCFGWIDSTANKRDHESHFQYFARRKPKSNWSRSNRERYERLNAEGMMAEAGLKMVELAKASGTWMAMEDVENNVVPDDLMKALKKNKLALKHYTAFKPSMQRIILAWIQGAKKPETRQKRIDETVALAEKNIPANQYIKKE
jgi:uncharacterized protein YdeI (YjbR/CyaY-like superfamily)